MTTPDTEKKPWHIVSVAPKVGGGNVVDAQKNAAHFQNKAAENPDAQPELRIEPAHIFTSILTGLAKWRHAQISSSAEQAILYAERNAQERDSFPAKLLKVDIAINLRGHLKRLLKKHHLTPKELREKPQVAVVSAQDMTIESLAKYGPNSKLTLALFLICSDVFGKFDPEKVELNNQIIHLFWNAEAYEKALETLPEEKVKLIIPTDPLEAFPNEPTSPLAEGGKPLIKLSGTGGHEETINAIAARLTSIDLAPTVVCEMPNKLRAYAAKKVATESDPGWYYHSLGEADQELPPYLICHPSEQVKHLIVLQQKGIFIPTIFLYPKGLHEAKNLAWAIKQGLSKVICVPKTLELSSFQRVAHDIKQGFSKTSVPEPELIDPRAEVAKLLAAEGIDPSEYRFVDPSEITQADFEKPTKAWEQPPKAQSLFDAVRTTLAGTDSLVKT